MNIETRKYALGTSLTIEFPWGIHHGGAALCSDGRVRKLARIAITADTFFSVPAAVKVKGKTVSGYITVDTLNDSESVVYFVAYTYGKNHNLLPSLATDDYPTTAQARIEQDEFYGRMPAKADCLEYLTQCADRQGRHYYAGYEYSASECYTCGGSNYAGHLYVPCSRYGSTSSECAPVAYRLCYVYSREGGVDCWLDSLDWAMGLVVNDSDSVAELIREYGGGHYR